ncbi:MAG: hypothetical protein AB7I50_10525 [Vicinamibacterales bacterium]
MSAHLSPALARPGVFCCALLACLIAVVSPASANTDSISNARLTFATYLGGAALEYAVAVATDSTGSIYLVGRTQNPWSGGFPRTMYRIGSTSASVIVAKLDSSGQQLAWATMVGGSDFDEAADIAVDADGAAYVTGRTYSADFPVANAYQATCASCVPAPTIRSDAFLFKLRPDGSGLEYSTFVGGAGHDSAIGVVLDTHDRASIAGTTEPTVTTCGGESEAWVRTFSSDGAVLLKSVVLGGPCGDSATSIAIDAAENLYVTVWNWLGDFPFKNPVIASPNPGGTATVLVKIAPTGEIVYATPLPWFGGEARVAAFSDGRVIVGSDAYTAPEGSGTRRAGPLGRSDLALVELDAAATAFSAPFYIGGTSDDHLRDLVIDSTGSIWVAGESMSSDFPWTNALQPTFTTAIARSTDKGVSFDPVTVPGFSGGIHEFATAPGGVVVYAATRLHGVLKSLDRGHSWTSASHGIEGLEVTSVAVSPLVPSIVLAAADGAVYKSIDSGGSWIRVGSPTTGIPEFVSQVGASASDDSVAFAGTATGIYVTRDGGASWRISMTGMPLPTAIADIVTDRGSPSYVFVATHNGVFVSHNDAVGWTAGDAGLPAYVRNVRGLAVDPAFHSTLYALIAHIDGRGAAIYRSVNSGLSWEPIASQPQGIQQTYLGLLHLAVNTEQATQLYASGAGLARSDDGGASWARVGDGLASPEALTALGAATVISAAEPTSDGVLIHLDLTSGSVDFATPLGGRSYDALAGIAVAPSGEVVVAGSTASTNLPTSNPIQSTLAGAYDWLVARLAPDADTDNDGLPDAWERQMGLSVGVDDSAQDADSDGVTNADEAAHGTHPRGVHSSYLAEGATGVFFDTEIALVNPDAVETAHVLLRFEAAGTAATVEPLLVPPLGRRTIDVAAVPGMRRSEFGTVVESDLPVAVSRTMRWDADAYGAHAGQAFAPSSTWYFAEGATTAGFQLFYLIANPGDDQVHVDVIWLPARGAPIGEVYVVAPHSRVTIWVNQVPGLTAAELGASFVTEPGSPVVVERAMYLDTGGQTFGAGHTGGGAPQPALTWLAAEGATGPFFDLFILLANPSAAEVVVDVRYLLPDESPIVKRYTVAPHSRFTIWVDQEHPALADTAVSVDATSVNGVGFVMERVMWWPGPTAATWYEAHAASATRETGIVWIVPDGLIRGVGNAQTYVLIANPADVAASARVTLLFEDGSRASATIDVPSRSRRNVSVRDEAWSFASTADLDRFQTGGRFGVIVESAGVETPLVVESATYWDAPDANRVMRSWAAGTSAGAVKLR